ncbi:hypothetical protein [Atlantibacter subterraneus]
MNNFDVSGATVNINAEITCIEGVSGAYKITAFIPQNEFQVSGA